MTYEVLRGFTANGRAYRPGERVEGRELKHEAQMATRRLIALVSQVEAHAAGAPITTAHPILLPPDRARGRS